MAPPAPHLERFYVRYAWLLMFGLALLLALGAGGMMATGANPPMQFETDTGVSWAAFSADYPTVATLVSLEDLLLGTAFVAFALLTAAIAATKYRAGERWAWRVLWLFPALLLATTVLMFTHDQAYVGYYYAGATALSVLGLGLPARRYLA